MLTSEGRPLTISAHSVPMQRSKAVMASFNTEGWRSEDRCRGWQTFSGKSQKVNILYSADHIKSL